MNDKLAWVSCEPISSSTPVHPLANATQISFSGGPVWCYREGYIKRYQGDRPIRVLIRPLNELEAQPDLSNLSHFDAMNAPYRVISPLGLLSTAKGPVAVARWVNGLDVETIQKRLRMLGSPLPPVLALEIGVQLLEILTHLESFGNPRSRDGAVVHGAIRPSTIRIGVDGHVHLVDMGVEPGIKSRNIRSKEPAATLCLPYLAPEQLADDDRESPLTDLYSVAVVIFELIAARPLFNGSAARRELEIRAGFGIQERLSNVGSEVPGLSDLLSRALSLTPEERFGSADSMKQALAALRGPSNSTQLAAVVQDLKAFRPSVKSAPTYTDSPGSPSSVLVTVTKPQALQAPRAPDGTVGPDRTVRKSRGAGVEHSHRSHFILGLIGAAVAIGAYAFITAPASSPAAHTAHIDRAVESYEGTGSAAVASPGVRARLQADTH